MDLKQIKDLMAAMEKAGVKKLTLKEKTGYELHLEMQEEHQTNASQPVHPHPSFFVPHPMHRHELPAHSHHHHAPMIEEAPKAKPAESKQEGKWVTSPMVGTFYAAPSPDDPCFVKVGDKVTEGTLVCIVEAMKVMNEVKAGMSGTIAEICLDNGHPVEFGTKLFRVV